MKKYISDKIYVASARPIEEVYLNGNSKTGDEVKYFLINPIIRSTIFGKSIIGGVEAVSKVKLFNCHYVNSDFDPTGYVFCDEISNAREVGDPFWDANFDLPADKILKKVAIEKYLNQTPEEVIQIINKMREDYKESVKGNDFSRALKQ